MKDLRLIGRSEKLFEEDLSEHKEALEELLKGSRILVIGGAGTIGQSVVLQLFQRHPRSLHVVDISENNLVELVRAFHFWHWPQSPWAIQAS